MTIKGLTNEQKDFIKIKIYQYFSTSEIYFFGSRVNDKYKPTSDIDICIKDVKALDLGKWGKLADDFSSSDLPFKVDLVDWHRIKADFQQVILKTGVKD